MNQSLVSPLADLHSLALGVCRKYRNGADNGGVRLDPWITDEVLHDAVQDAFLSVFDGEPFEEGDEWQEIEPEQRAHFVGLSRALVKAWAVSPGRYHNGTDARGFASLEVAEHELAHMTDASADLAAYRETHEEARAIMAELTPAHRATLDALAGRTAQPAIEPKAWYARCDTARAALSDAIAERTDETTCAPSRVLLAATRREAVDLPAERVAARCEFLGSLAVALAS